MKVTQYKINNRQITVRDRTLSVHETALLLECISGGVVAMPVPMAHGPTSVCAAGCAGARGRAGGAGVARAGADLFGQRCRGHRTPTSAQSFRSGQRYHMCR